MEDNHTHHIGKTTDGRQFFGYETFAHPMIERIGRNIDGNMIRTVRFDTDYINSIMLVAKYLGQQLCSE
jgi:hypothetical protein